LLTLLPTTLLVSTLLTTTTLLAAALVSAGLTALLATTTALRSALRARRLRCLGARWFGSPSRFGPGGLGPTFLTFWLGFWFGFRLGLGLGGRFARSGLALGFFIHHGRCLSHINLLRETGQSPVNGTRAIVPARMSF
jgi:hypothetical protein